MFYEEIDYESDEDYDYNEFTEDIISEFDYDKKIQIISFYKEKLMKEPEFIGIKNICAGEILVYIQKLTKPMNITKKDYKLNLEQYNLFVNMYSELNLIGNYDIFNSVTKKIFKKIYV